MYGETPWSALYKMSKAFEITSSDVLYDMGCGLGKSCFWFSHVVGCQVVGIDNQIEFIRFSSRIHKMLSSKTTLFRLQDFKDVSLSDASCVYFYGSSYSLRVLKDLMQVFSKLSSGSYVISISFPLDFLPLGSELFFVEKSCSVRFPWGKTMAYKNIRR
ncbi:class I SAM-dependent methyltransferase [Chlamydia sp. 17-3921]|uniref:class I SAM-dependent methyltransferase n=1 Tax=Chlamydia sp. 17-3921 TaxID=2675798 RepID=UPI00271541F0|nr:class I SAM-dependent methyltransferase [Chlamydia sp. 17-3921]